MKLTELEPEFVVATHDGWRGWIATQAVGSAEALADAQGVWFLCPVCFRQNGGNVGTHGILVWFRDRGVPDDQVPGPGRWVVSGTGLADLTLTPSIDISRGRDGTPSKCQNEPGWHGFVTNGDVLG